MDWNINTSTINIQGNNFKTSHICMKTVKKLHDIDVINNSNVSVKLNRNLDVK